MNRRLTLLIAFTSCLASSLATAGSALAQATTPPPAAAPSAPPAPASATAPDAPPPVAPEATSAGEASWDYRYELARDRLANGDFATAARLFDELLPQTRDSETRALVALQAHLAHEWQRRGLTLVKASALGEGVLSAKSVGERSTDEIAILYTNAVLYGLGSGAWIAVVTQPNSTAGVILPMLTIGGAAVGAVALLDSGRPLRYGVPQSIVSGLYIGLEEGFALSMWGSQASGWSGSAVASTMWGFSTAGALAGGVLGSTVGTTPGRASFVGTSALWTGALSALTSEALASGGSDAPFLAAAVGVGAGMVGGALAAGPVSPSIARVRFLDLGGLAGGLVTGGIYLSAANHNADQHAASGITALGIAGGLAAAWVATSGMTPDRIEPQETQKQGAVSWSPTLAPVNQGMMIGLAGTM